MVPVHALVSINQCWHHDTVHNTLLAIEVTQCLDFELKVFDSEVLIILRVTNT